jgi:tetratricopeptide (TPR) repeat protein
VGVVALQKEKKFDAAIEELQKHPDEENGAYYYNLGTLHYQAGRLGTGLAYLEKANRLQRHDPDIQENLRIARKALKKDLGEGGELDPSSDWLHHLADRVGLDEIRGAAGLVGFVLIFFWTRSYRKFRSLRKTFSQPAGIMGLIGMAMVAALYVASRVSEASPPAAFLRPDVIRSGPGETYAELSRAEAGTRTRLTGLSANSESPPVEPWNQIRYGDAGIGWVKSSSLLPL